MEDFFRIGVITTPHGIKGEVKVFPTTDDLDRFDELEDCFLKIGNEYKAVTCTGVKYFKNMVILKFAEYNDMNAAETLRQCEVYVDREHAVPLEEGEYYLADVIGATVYDEDGNWIGKLKDYMETTVQTIFIIEKEEGGEMMVPAVPEFIKDVDVAAMKIVIHLIPGL